MTYSVKTCYLYPMFFVISKLLVIFVSPATWILLLFIAGLIIKDQKRKRRCFKASIILLIIFTNPFLLDQFARKWDIPPQQLPDSTHYSCAILMGGFNAEDRDGKGYFTGAADRFIQTLKLKAQNKVSHILISGGSGKLIPGHLKEADFAQSELKAFNIPDSAILTENQSRNSFENASNSKKILDSLHLASPYILITSGFHMRRASYTFRKMGVKVIPFPCNYIAGREKTSLSSFIPNIGTLSGWDFYIKEIMGMVVYRFKHQE
jgi:uncharacterized SAM-binding protein YcdF (DUF218 family)